MDLEQERVVQGMLSLLDSPLKNFEFLGSLHVFEYEELSGGRLGGGFLVESAFLPYPLLDKCAVPCANFRTSRRAKRVDDETQRRWLGVPLVKQRNRWNDARSMLSHPERLQKQVANRIRCNRILGAIQKICHGDGGGEG